MPPSDPTPPDPLPHDPPAQGPLPQRLRGSGLPAAETAAISAAVERLLRDGSWAAYEGEATDRLRQQLAGRWDCPHVRLCCSGTAALELALRAHRVGAGDEVLLCGYDFPGNLRTVELVGARPALVDCLAGEWTVDPQQVIEASGPATRAAIISHLYGAIADVERLARWAEQRGILLIEDACQTPGGRLGATPLGSWGGAGILSFGGSKPLTAGCGGALLTRDARLAQRARSLAERPSDAFPLSQIQAALLTPQVEHLEQIASQRRRAVRDLLAAWHPQAASATAAGWRPMPRWRESESPDFYKLAWFAPDRAVRDRAVAAAEAVGLPAGKGYRSASRMSPKRCRMVGALPAARACGERLFVLDHRVLRGDAAETAAVATALATCMAAAAEGTRPFTE